MASYFWIQQSNQFTLSILNPKKYFSTSILAAITLIAGKLEKPLITSHQMQNWNSLNTHANSFFIFSSVYSHNFASQNQFLLQI